MKVRSRFQYKEISYTRSSAQRTTHYAPTIGGEGLPPTLPTSAVGAADLPIGRTFATIVLDTQSCSISGILLSYAKEVSPSPSQGTFQSDSREGDVNICEVEYETRNIVPDPKYCTPTEPSGAAAMLALRMAMGLLAPDQGETGSPTSEVIERYSNKVAAMHRGEATRAGDEDQGLADAKA